MPNKRTCNGFNYGPPTDADQEPEIYSLVGTATRSNPPPDYDPMHIIDFVSVFSTFIYYYSLLHTLLGDSEL